MGLSTNFARWLEASRALEQARRADLPPEAIANAIRLYSETLEALLREIVATVRRNETLIKRLANTYQEVIEAEISPLRDRQTELSIRVHQVEQARAEPEDAHFDAPGD